ncbi:response regulator [Pseudogemmobacter sp. W21_MBD1_M6]|uniref:response regulator n=1 Tax=Pseudogemmobacter sp. W21_MBD1_M6 TaxID=3240271 RepID=UPI003F96D7CB
MKILAVDDDTLILELLPLVLASSGYTDVEVSNMPDKAMERIEDENTTFECFLLDIQMPGTDGIELCRKVRAITRYRKTPIIMLTAMHDKGYIDHAFEAGATDYITKPFDVTELGARLRVAETLQQAYTVIQELRFEGTSVGAGDTQVDTATFTQPHFIDDIDGAVDKQTLGNYLSQLSSAGIQGTNIFAVKVDQAQRIHAQAKPSEFSYALSEIADAIGESLKCKGFFLMAYAGAGAFLCVSHASNLHGVNAIEFEIQCEIDERQLAFDNGKPMDITVSMGQWITPHFRKSMRYDRVFSVAIARAEGRFEEKKLEPFEANFVKSAMN